MEPWEKIVSCGMVGVNEWKPEWRRVVSLVLVVSESARTFSSQSDVLTVL